MDTTALMQLKALLDQITAVKGITTDPGNVGGTSFKDSKLIGAGVGSFVGMLAVVYTGDPAKIDSSDINTFNNATGEVSLTRTLKGGQVPAGTPYAITPFRFMPATLPTVVSQILGDVGDASASAMGSLYGILGNPAQSFLAMIGYEGATALANKLTAARATNLDSCTYLEQVAPILMNSTQTLNNTAGDKDFIGSNLTGAVGLVSTVDAKVVKVFLLIIGRAVNSYAGTNALDCTTATHNQWQINLDGGAYSDLVNEEPDGQMLDNDWRCAVEGAIHPFTLMFEVTSQMTNIDGKIGIRLQNGRSEQASLIVTVDVYLRVLWKL